MEKLVVLQDLTSDPTLVKSARIEEGLSRLTEIVVEFACDDANLELETLIGKQARLGSLLPDGTSRRHYCGICVEARFVGSDDRDRSALRPLRGDVAAMAVVPDAQAQQPDIPGDDHR